MANNNLLEHDKILFFSFSFDEGGILSNAGKLVRDPHFSFWKETLPLVLEKVAEKTTQHTNIDIFVEEVEEQFLTSNISDCLPSLKIFLSTFFCYRLCFFIYEKMKMALSIQG